MYYMQTKLAAAGEYQTADTIRIFLPCTQQEKAVPVFVYLDFRRCTNYYIAIEVRFVRRLSDAKHFV